MKNEDSIKTIKYNNDKKFDIQLSQSLIHERELGEIFQNGKIELKTENWQWERTQNICIEFEMDQKPSGIATTEAEVWIHQLKRGDETLVWLMFPVERLKRLFELAKKQNRVCYKAGDGGRFSVALIPLRELYK